MLLAGSLVFYVAYQEWLSCVLLLFVVGLPWLSLAASLPAMENMRLELDAPERLTMSSRGEATLAGRCALPHPPVRGKIQVKFFLTGESRIIKSGEDLPTKHCGGLLLQPVRARVYDYLGLFRKKIRKTESRTVLVLPRRVEMRTPPDLERYLAKAWRPKFGGGFAENHELRLYRPGDNLNQVHWKLSAKTGKLILREPMEPERGLVLLTLDLCGTPEELDCKFGRLLWLGEYLLERNVAFQVRALTASGVESWTVDNPASLHDCIRNLLCTAPARTGTIRDRAYQASWQHYIGGEPDEA